MRSASFLNLEDPGMEQSEGSSLAYVSGKLDNRVAVWTW